LVAAARNEVHAMQAMSSKYIYTDLSKHSLPPAVAELSTLLKCSLVRQ
jgi:hypothetical protein